MTRPSLAFAFLLAVVGLSPDASAFDLWKLSVGGKATAGVNVWASPDKTPPTSIGFTESRAGYGVGGGIFVEGRFFQFVALEMDLLYEWDAIWETQDFGGLIKTKTKAITHNFRIPLLVKGVLPLPMVRLSLGLGPEFVVPVGSDTETSAALKTQFKVKTKTSTMLAMNFGVVINPLAGLLIPVDLRASYNLTQPKSYKDRVEIKTVGTAVESITILYQNTWDFRLLLGLGYEF